MAEFGFEMLRDRDVAPQAHTDVLVAVSKAISAIQSGTEGTLAILLVAEKRNCFQCVSTGIAVA